MSGVDPNPKKKPAYAPIDELYYDEVDLTSELRRVFDVCHTCRMCLPYCPSFPDLFARVDRDIEKGVAKGAEALKSEDFHSVTDNCFQCKLCYIKCPYTEDEGHSWLLDVPRLLLREKAVRARRDGVTLQDKVLGEPQLLGQLGAGPQGAIANFVHAQSLVRKGMEKTLGISAKFPLPPFASQSFPSWFLKHESPADLGENGEVVLFSTCYLDYNTTGPAIAAVRVLEANKVKVFWAEGQTCCGMPNLDGGDIERAQEKARANVAALLPHVRAGRAVVIPGPTCSYTLHQEYPDLLGTEEAKEVAGASIDLMRWIDQNLRRKKKLNKNFSNKLGKVALHAPCHLRAQKIGVPSQAILEAAGAEVEVVAECSAVDGTWGMKEQFYEEGRKIAQKMVRGMRDVAPDLYVTDCPLSALRMQKEIPGTNPAAAIVTMHPIEALAHAYGIR